MQAEASETYDEFRTVVNLTPAELERWLETDESQAVGMTGDGDTKPQSTGAESRGHESGRLIVDVLRKKKDDLTDDDVAQMRRVVGYVRRHLAQRPSGDVEHSRWRHSLLNWGHDPLKD